MEARLVSRDASNDPPLRGYIEVKKLMETPTLGHWREECGRFYRCLEKSTHLYTMVEGMRGVQGFL